LKGGSEQVLSWPLKILLACEVRNKAEALFLTFFLWDVFLGRATPVFEPSPLAEQKRIVSAIEKAVAPV
jgi:hypothetical protein